MPKEIDRLFEKEKDLSSHLKDLGVILLDLSDSVKDKLSEKDQNEVKDLLSTFAMNCDAMRDDITGAEAILKGIKTKTITMRDSTLNTAELKQHLSEVKTAVQKLRNSAGEFLQARDREMVFQEMNKSYSDVLGSLTELMAESV